MTTLFQNHLEQISLSATAIAELPFPPPKMFVNALLGPHDITTLIRDTEAHERALFTTDPSANSMKPSHRRATRRGTMFPADTEKETMLSRIQSARSHRNQSAVARVLGGDMMEAIRRSANASTNRGELDIEIILRGSEMLCKAYPVEGAQERIASLRRRYREVSDSIAHLEERVNEQAGQLEQMNRSAFDSSEYYSPDLSDDLRQQPLDPTEDDIARELEAIRELEAQKRFLEERDHEQAKIYHNTKF